MREGESTGQPVTHFEIIGQDADKLRSYYSELFGWEFTDPEGHTIGVVKSLT